MLLVIFYRLQEGQRHTWSVYCEGGRGRGSTPVVSGVATTALQSAGESPVVEWCHGSPRLADTHYCHYCRSIGFFAPSGVVFSLHNVADSVISTVIMAIVVAMETRRQHNKTQISISTSSKPIACLGQPRPLSQRER